jgi:GNAT superfamily N-acetyltransferase
MTPVRKATYADVRPVSVALAKAFEDDPVMEWLMPTSGRNRFERLRRFFALDMQSWNLRHDETWTTPELSGGALWAPPGKWKLSVTDIVRSGPTLSRVLGSRLPLALRGLGEIERRHPREPHYHLAILGTEPAHQGKGIGGALMAPVLDRCDDDGIGAYLESSKERNVPYYRRFGFEVVEELTLPKGPPLWLMWRDPR